MYGQLSISKSKLLRPTQGDTIQIDSGFVVNESISIQGYTPQKDFTQLGNKIVWLSPNAADSVTVKYKRLYFKVSYENKSQKIIQQEFQQNPFKYTPSKSASKMLMGH